MSILQRTLWFVVLLTLQVLVFNHVHIYGYATPMPFVYVLLILHSKTPRWVYITMAFALGLLVDIASSTIGIFASTATLTGLLAPKLLTMFAPPDLSDDGFLPSARTMKWSGFIRFATAVTLIQCTTFFMVEAFSFFHLTDLLLNIAASSVITLLVLLAIEQVRISANRR